MSTNALPPPVWVETLINLHQQRHECRQRDDSFGPTLAPGSIVPGPFPSHQGPLFIRAEYAALYSCIMESRQTLIEDFLARRKWGNNVFDHGTFVVLGDSGAGKKVSLAVIAAACVLNEVPVVVMDDSGLAYYFDRGKAVVFNGNCRTAYHTVCLYHENFIDRRCPLVCGPMFFVMTWSVGSPKDWESFAIDICRRTLFYAIRPWPFSEFSAVIDLVRKQNQTKSRPAEELCYTHAELYKLFGPDVPTATRLSFTRRSTKGLQQDFSDFRQLYEELLRQVEPALHWPWHVRDGFKYLSNLPVNKTVRSLFLACPHGPQPSLDRPSFRCAVRSPWILYLVRNHFQTNCPAGHRSSETDEPFGQTFEPLDWFWLKNRNCPTIVSKCACSNGGEITLPVFKGGSSLRSRRILRSGTGVPQLEVGVLYPFESDSAIDLVAALDHPSKTFLLFTRSQRLAAWHTDEAVLGNIQDALRLLGETIPTDLGSPFKLRAKYLLVCLVRNTNVAQRIVATNTGVKGCLIPVIVLDCSLPTVWKQYKTTLTKNPLILLGCGPDATAVETASAARHGE